MLSVFVLLSALAGAALPPLAVLRSPETTDVARRVRAQLVDTAWRLEEGPPRGSLVSPLDADLELGQGRDAVAVIEVSWSQAGILVRLTDVAGGRAYVRAVALLDPDGPGAATEEAAALLIRDSLVALATTGAIDWTIEAERPPWRWEVGLLGCGSADGLTVAPSVGVYFGLSRSGWFAALGGFAGWPRDRSLEGVGLRLQRHVVRMSFGRRFDISERGFVELGPSAGLALHRRETLAADGGAPADPTVVAAGLVGAAGRVGIRFGFFKVWLAAGIDAVFGAPALEVSRHGEPTEIDRGWPTAPWLTVGLSSGRDPISRSRDPISTAAPSISSGTGRVGR